MKATAELKNIKQRTDKVHMEALELEIQGEPQFLVRETEPGALQFSANSVGGVCMSRPREGSVKNYSTYLAPLSAANQI